MFYVADTIILSEVTNLFENETTKVRYLPHQKVIEIFAEKKEEKLTSIDLNYVKYLLHILTDKGVYSLRDACEAKQFSKYFYYFLIR